MQIGDIVQLDQKNRLHIPQNVLKAAGIEHNSMVVVNVELGSNVITIQSVNQAVNNKIEEIKRILK